MWIFRFHLVRWSQLVSLGVVSIIIMVIFIDHLSDFLHFGIRISKERIASFLPFSVIFPTFNTHGSLLMNALVLVKVELCILSSPDWSPPIDCWSSIKSLCASLRLKIRAIVWIPIFLLGTSGRLRNSSILLVLIIALIITGTVNGNINRAMVKWLNKARQVIIWDTVGGMVSSSLP